MTEDLLTRIQRETHERLRELRGAVDEHDRLQAELRALDAPGPSAKVALPAAPGDRSRAARCSRVAASPSSPSRPEPGRPRMLCACR